ncbi:MAG: phage terminase small subunit P27 family [Chlorobiaceae bacterium]|nr:phage terminase small subunit P27 family [Chlorobiaceae bacterium]
MRGRKPQPTNLHIIKGTYRADRHSQTAEALSSSDDSLLTPPSWLKADAKKEWKLEAKMAIKAGILTHSDRSAFADLCILQARVKQAYKDMHTFAESIKKKAAARGGTWEYDTILPPNQSGYFAQNPFIPIYNKALKDLNQLRAEFGMTPSSRTRIKIDKPAEDNPFAALSAMQ